MKKWKVIFGFMILLVGSANAQDVGQVSGQVINASTREPIPYISVAIPGTSMGSITNDTGYFLIKSVPLGYVPVSAFGVGYITNVSSEVLVTKGRVPYISIALEPEVQTQEDIVIVVDQKVFQEDKMSPLSKQTLTVTEIEKNPGSNRDISRVIESLPGVASSTSFRNDIVIRGGAPSENSFYLDGVEVPVINHFQTQGASGGPVGILNANLISNVDFRSSAFPVHRGSTVSSVIEFKQKYGNAEKLNTRFTLGSSDMGLTMDGPLGEKTTYIFSVRQSYLQFLFSALKLPFLPTFNDAQFNVRKVVDDKNEYQIIGLGALDRFKLNESVNENITDPDQIKFNNYTLQNIPIQEQWNYTIGGVWTHYGKSSKQRYVISRNSWNNTSIKYKNNDDSDEANLLLNYKSREDETKARYESIGSIGKYDFIHGAGAQWANYINQTYQQVSNSSGQGSLNYNSNLSFLKYNVFGQLNRAITSKLSAGFGLRFDASTYSQLMANPLNQISPRLTVSYQIDPKLKFNAHVGRYHQLPAYTMLGFRNNSGELINQQNNIQYISTDHLVSGLELKPDDLTRVTIEGFYKRYNQYPYSLKDSISVANIGSDFGVVGNEEVNSTSKGRAYGVEFLIQRRSYSGLYGILAYTLVRSEFTISDGSYAPSSWDNRHLLTFTGGIKLKKNWQIGAKFRIIGGRPYTPYDYNQSALISNWDVNNQGVFDYAQINTLRQNIYNQLDVRVDKTWFKDKYTLNLYLDIQNIYNYQIQEQSILTTQKDESGNSIVDPSDTSRYLIEELKSTAGLLLPTIGIILDF